MKLTMMSIIVGVSMIGGAAINCPQGVSVKGTFSGGHTPSNYVLQSGNQTVSYSVTGRCTMNGDNYMTIVTSWFHPFAKFPDMPSGTSSRGLTPSGASSKTLSGSRQINVPSPSKTWSYPVSPSISFASKECEGSDGKTWTQAYVNYTQSDED